jgi:hypothetical protein
MLGRQDFLQRFKQELFFFLFCLFRFLPVAGANFLRSRDGISRGDLLHYLWLAVVDLQNSSRL